MDENEELIGRTVYVILKTGRKYTGIVNSVKNNKFYITDKFGQPVMFDISEISSLEVEKNE